ncbi:AI-2E family transporter [Paenibacillus sp. GCM10027627]|uniref:AI-2E family transporter n=1 Tax=unclassified Paenibacillus TaxID=185978 RepID=UPI00364042A0
MSCQEKKRFKWLIAAILIFLLLYLIHLNRHLLQPALTVLNAVFWPFAVTGVLYYLLRPLVNGLERFKMPRAAAVLLVFFCAALLIAVLVWSAGPFVRDQFESFIEEIPNMAAFAADSFDSLKKESNSLSPPIREAIPDMRGEMGSAWKRYAGSVANSVMQAIGWISNMLLVLSLVPFILYYALKDGSLLAPKLARLAPLRYQRHLPELLSELDDTLSSFILGKALVSLVAGVLLLGAYLAIGLDFALVLAIIGMAANIVPFFGPVIGAVPAVIVALFQDPMKALYVVIATIAIQQIEGNLISPQIMGRTMNIHPVTVIVLILAAGSFSGLLGVLLAVPLYAVAKVMLSHAFKLYRANEKGGVTP